MRNRSQKLHLSRLQATALLLVAGANLLVWSVFALSAAGVGGLPLGALPSATPTVAPLVWTAPLSASATALALPPTGEPVAVPPIPIGEDTLVVALLGADRERTSPAWRTDAIVLAFVEQEAKRVSLLSIPRDLWVYIPDRGYDRVNAVDALGELSQHPGGGLALLDKTLHRNLGVPVDHYLRIDFDGFVRVIDAVGGVTVNVDRPVEDLFPDPSSPTGEFSMDLAEGPQHMDGRTALAYCRSRWSTSDFDRARRQQKVLVALRQQALTPDALAQAPQLWDALSGVFETDLTQVEALQLAHLISGIEPQDVRSKRLDAATVTAWTTPQGAQVLLPQAGPIRGVIVELLSLPE